MERKKSRLICLMLAFILLFSGMCSQTIGTHSVLASSYHTSETDTIQKGEVDSYYIRTCTNKLITGMRDTLQVVRKSHRRLNFRSSVNLYCVEEILHNLLFYCCVAVAIVYQVQGSDTTILNYIHKQDGEK